MRRVRIIAVGLALVSIIVGIAAAMLVYQRDRIASLVVERIRQRSGFELVAVRSSLTLGSHLGVVLQEPRVLDQGREVARLKRLELLFSYHALLHADGLPLYAMYFEYPEFRLPFRIGMAAGAGLPRLDSATSASLQGNLRRLSSVTRKLGVVEATVFDLDNRPVLQEVSLFATRRRRAGSPWKVRFIGSWMGTPLHGLRVAGNLRFGVVAREAREVIAHGEFWVWNATLDGLRAVGWEAAGTVQGKFVAALRSDGGATFSGGFDVQRLAVSGPSLNTSTKPYDCSLEVSLDLSSSQLRMEQLRLRHDGRTILAGDGYVAQPYADNPTVGLRLGGLVLDAASLKAQVELIRDAPDWLREARVGSGRISIDEFAFDSTVQDLRSGSAILLKKIVADARLSDLEVSLPPGANLPAVHGLEAQVALARGVMTLTQGHAALGDSRFDEISLRADFSRGMQRWPYSLQLRGEVSLGELYGPAMAFLGERAAAVRQEVKRLEGVTMVSLDAAGRLDGFHWAAPSRYEVTLGPRSVEVAVKTVLTRFTFTEGTAVLRPGSIVLEHLVAVAKQGSATFDGTVEVAEKGLGTRSLRIQLREIRAEDWIPLVLGQDTFAAKGPVVGEALVNIEPSHPENYSVKGALKIGPGEIQFGFLRSPVSLETATLTLSGRGAEFAMKGSKLEGNGLDLKLAIADFRRPVLHIDALVDNLDLEVMKFIRLPWSQKGAVSFFGHLRASGHVEARRGNLAKLAMTDLKTDFVRDVGGWKVYDFVAHTLEGRVNMEIGGRAQDEWIHIRGHAAEIDVQRLLNLMSQDADAVLVGNLYADLDLWANTDVDFFETLAGKCSLVVKDGTLNRFTLLSRMLGMIDLKNWLTAQIPDPRLVGVPLTALSAHFAGSQGNFYTDDLFLEGPVMDISAAGSVNVGRGTLDMQVGMFPFQTVSWLVNKIPIIGKDISNNTGGVLAAYFKVQGPARDPMVTPEPITSVAELIKKTLGLPINIIRPKTIR